MAFFTEHKNGAHHTTVRNIILARRFFMEHPTGKIYTGIWTEEYWTKQQFYRWFNNRLNYKCGIKPMTERETLLMRDCFIIRQYTYMHIVYPGSNILTTNSLKKRFPHINNPTIN